MATMLRLLLLIVLLNVIRYVVAGPIEQLTVMPALFGAMQESSAYFNTTFTATDWITSFLYNFLMWTVVVVAFHLMHARIGGSWWRRSFLVMGLMYVFFASVSAIYMNHYSHPPDFYLLNIADGLIAFAVVAAANALLYRRIVPADPGESREPVPAHSA
jgi:hypothetical protein